MNVDRKHPLWLVTLVQCAESVIKTIRWTGKPARDWYRPTPVLIIRSLRISPGDEAIESIFNLAGGADSGPFGWAVADLLPSDGALKAIDELARTRCRELAVRHADVAHVKMSKKTGLWINRNTGKALVY